MEILQYTIRKLITGIPLILGVTLISFILMVYFGPDKTYELLGKNPTQEQITEVRHQLGYDKPFTTRYAEYLKELATLNFGYSDSTGERVSTILKRTIPISLALITPGFVLGNLLGIALALIAAYHRGKWQDKFIMGGSVVGMSISFLIVIIAFQIIFSSSYGLDWFPVRGWNVYSLGDYLAYVTVPTLATVFVSLGYNTRFYRAVIVEEMGRDHVRTGPCTYRQGIRHPARPTPVQEHPEECHDPHHHPHHVFHPVGGDLGQPADRELLRHSGGGQGFL